MKVSESRKKVWKSLSELYLDTELQENDFKHIAYVLKQSGFSLLELKEIDLYEVLPALHTNLLATAGVWAQFDEEWLYKECTKNYKKRNSKLHQFLSRLKRKLIQRGHEGDWERIEQYFGLSN